MFFVFPRESPWPKTKLVDWKWIVLLLLLLLLLSSSLQNLIYTLFFSQPFYVCDRITKELFPQRERDRGRRVGTSLTFLYVFVSDMHTFHHLLPPIFLLDPFLSITHTHTHIHALTRTLLSLSNPFAYYSSGPWLRPRCDVNILININCEKWWTLKNQYLSLQQQQQQH